MPTGCLLVVGVRQGEGLAD